MDIPTEKIADVSDCGDEKSSGLAVRKNYMSHSNRFFTADLIDTPIYNKDMMDSLLAGIVQNIYIEMEKQHMTVRGLGEIAGINYSHLCNLFGGRTKIGLTALIKLSYALHLSPCDLFPYDENKRKTNGQRFNEITKGLDIQSSNFILNMAADYAKECRRLGRK
ncbi:MAG: helix-turn-helix transcriptional regulator [Roseburia sp.]|nr:helix-turn-helix transcriptional regulator [Roseburia sp.]